MRLRRVLIPAAAFWIGTVAVPAPEPPKETKLNTGTICGTYASITSKLESRYREVLLHVGVHPQFRTEIWHNPNTTTFTVLAVVGARACMIAVGDRWDGKEPGVPA